MISWHKMTKSPVVFTQKQMGENVESKKKKKKSNGCLVCTTVLMSKKHHKHHYDSEHSPSSDGYRTISPYSDSQRAISLSRCGHKAISLLRWHSAISLLRWHRAISLSRWPQNILPLEITIEQDRSRDCHRAIPPLWVAKHARSHARARTHTHPHTEWNFRYIRMIWKSHFDVESSTPSTSRRHLDTNDTCTTHWWL